MAERMKDAEDLKLESMFRSEPVPDEGFSASVMKRVRRQVWIRRLSLPLAVALGVAISAKPLLQVAGIASGLVETIVGRSISLEQLPVADLPQASTILIGLSLVMAAMLASRLLEE